MLAPLLPVDFFWHTSCDTVPVARKYYNSLTVLEAMEIAALNLRTGMIPLAGLRPPPRIRKLPTVRRRLPVTIIPNTAKSVIIRHVSQNLGNVISEAQPVQIRHV